MEKSNTMAEICGTLDKKARKDLRLRLVVTTACSETTIRNWMSGAKFPQAKPTRDVVAEVVSQFTGDETDAKTLFPNAV